MTNESKRAKNARRWAEHGAAVFPVLQAATVVGTAAAAGTSLLVASAPVSVTLLLISLFSVQILRMYGANKEFEVNCVAITEEVTRMYHIIEVIKQFSTQDKYKGKQIQSLKFNKVNVWVDKVLAGLVKMAGDNAFYQIEKELKASSASPSFIEMFDKFKKKRQQATRFKAVMRNLRRVLQPLEQLRIVVRDITILSIFFQIMLGEFHILLLADTTDPWLTENKAYISFKSQIDRLSQTVVDNNIVKAAEAAAVAVAENEAATAAEAAAAAAVAKSEAATKNSRVPPTSPVEEASNVAISSNLARSNSASTQDPTTISRSPSGSESGTPINAPADYYKTLANRGASWAPDVPWSRGGTRRKRSAKFERKTYKMKY